MTIFLAILIACLGVEIFLRLPIAQSTAQMAGSGLRAGRVIMSRRISEHWKEKVMPSYAMAMARQTLRLAGYFCFFAATLAASLFLIELVRPEAAQFVTSLKGLMLGLGASVLYYPVRRRLVGA